MKKYFQTYGSFLAIVFILGALVGLSKYSHSHDTMELLIWAPWLTILTAILCGLLEWHRNIQQRTHDRVVAEHEVLQQEYEKQHPDTVKVAKIGKGSSPFTWYYGREGEQFEVQGCEDFDLWHTVRCIATHAAEGEPGYSHRGWIHKNDCEIIEVPKSEWDELETEKKRKELEIENGTPKKEKK